MIGVRRKAGFMLRAWVLAAALSACDEESPSELFETELTEGRWGGEDVGLILGEGLAHVHFGCTYGDFPLPLALDEDRRFNVAGEYLLRAFPVAVGPPLPARLSGIVQGTRITLTVAVNDTVEDRLVLLGPATVVYGREAEMGPCPICDMPSGSRLTARLSAGS
jgi:hypothetical protein